MRLAATTILVCGALAAFTGCGKDDDDKAAENAVNLLGTWTETCTQSTDDADKPVDGSAIVSYTFTENNTVVLETKTFKDNACATGEFSLRLSGTYTTAALAGSTEGASKIDIKITKEEIAAQSAEMVGGFNAEKWCGKTDWAVGTYVARTKATCTGNSAPAFDPGETFYNIYKATGNALYFGKTGAEKTGATDATRPTTLDKVQATKA